MARRNIMKTYSELVNGPVGQSNMGNFMNYNSINVENDKLRDINSLVKKDDSQRCSKPPCTPQMTSTRTWDKMKANEGSAFVGIDGDELSYIETRKPTIENEENPTVHKVQRYISLKDLTNRAGSQSHKKNTNHISKTGRINDLETAKNVKRSLPKAAHLPKGIYHCSEPYVVPRFTPTFKEMISGKTKPDVLVSITEKNPPSMQKWAIEWNAEPKHGISIDELKEDISNENSLKYNQAILNDNAGATIDTNDTKNYVQASESTRKTSSVVDTQPLTHGKRYFRTKSTNRIIDEDDFSSQTFIDSVQPNMCFNTNMENIEKSKSTVGTSNLSIDWLPEKHHRIKTMLSKDSSNKKYSFKEVLRNVQQTGKSEKMSAPEDNIYSEDKLNFYEWFNTRLTQANEAYHPVTGVKNNAANNKYGNSEENSPVPDSKHQQGSSYQTNEQSKKRLGSNSSYSQMLPSKINRSKVPQLPLGRYESQKNSSFYYWLINRVNSQFKVNANPVEIVDELSIQTHSKYPWSKSYICKYAPTSTNMGTDNYPYGPTNDQATTIKKNNRQHLSKSNDSQNESMSRIDDNYSSDQLERVDNKFATSALNHFRGYSCPRWVVNNETDYVRSLNNANSKMTDVVRDRTSMKNNSVPYQTYRNSRSINYGESKPPSRNDGRSLESKPYETSTWFSNRKHSNRNVNRSVPVLTGKYQDIDEDNFLVDSLDDIIDNQQTALLNSRAPINAVSAREQLRNFTMPETNFKDVSTFNNKEGRNDSRLDFNRNDYWNRPTVPNYKDNVGKSASTEMFQSSKLTQNENRLSNHSISLHDSSKKNAIDANLIDNDDVFIQNDTTEMDLNWDETIGQRSTTFENDSDLIRLLGDKKLETQSLPSSGLHNIVI